MLQWRFLKSMKLLKETPWCGYRHCLILVAILSGSAPVEYVVLRLCTGMYVVVCC